MLADISIKSKVRTFRTKRTFITQRGDSQILLLKHMGNIFISASLNVILFLFFRMYKIKVMHQLLLLFYARYLENSCAFADALTQQIPLHHFF